MKSFIWHSKATRVHPLPSPPPLSSNPRGSRKTINREPINNLTSKNQPTHQSLNQSTNQSINQSTIPSIKQSVHQPTNQPTRAEQRQTTSNITARKAIKPNVPEPTYKLRNTPARTNYDVENVDIPSRTSFLNSWQMKSTASKVRTYGM